MVLSGVSLRSARSWCVCGAVRWVGQCVTHIDQLNNLILSVTHAETEELYSYTAVDVWGGWDDFTVLQNGR